ncbi:hypothetical protein, partial [Xenorhabdus bovienii]|uniref:hypothetical protein n=1 Tax=Xenorhabdus bovienii TaxID=40576 RepID=UPI0023B27A1F
VGQSQMTLCVTDSYSQMTVSVNDIYSQNLHNSIRGVDKRVSQKQGVKSFCPAPCAQAIR